MNGLDNILRRIHEDAQREMEAMEQEAQAQREAILASGKAQAEEILTTGRQRNRADADSHKTRLVNAANMEARRLLLQTKQQYMDDCFAAARQQVSALSPAEYTDYLARWVANAAESGQEEVIFSSHDLEKLGKRVVAQANVLRKGAAFTLAGETREMEGVVLRQGKVEINGTLDARFRGLRERLAGEVAQMLFCDR